MDVVTSDRLTGAWLLLVLVHAQAHAEPTAFCGTQQWRPIIKEASVRFDIPATWIHAVIRAESAGCTHMNGQLTTSVAGAMGLMQLMPKTWQTYQGRLHLGEDPHNPSDNVLAGVAYLRDLYDAYGQPGLFAAYHAGPARFEDHLSSGRPLPNATIEYLRRVQQPVESSTRSPEIVSDGDGTPAPRLFVRRKVSTQSADPSADVSGGRVLFVSLRRGRPAVDHAAKEPDHVQDR